MPKGISETDVHQAADALVARGERPTVERIRAHLGTGSPNTVTRWLDTWWQQLGARLSRAATQAALPTVPATVAGLASQVWEHAIEAARGVATEELGQERAQLSADRTKVEAERSTLRQELEEARRSTARAEAEKVLSEARLVELQQFSALQGQQAADLIEQRNQVEARLTRKELELESVRAHLHQTIDAATEERARASEHVQSVEDRAHAEVDLARQQAKELRARLAERTKDCEARIRTLAQQHESDLAIIASLRQDLAVTKAEATAIQRELDTVRRSVVPPQNPPTTRRGTGGEKGAKRRRNPGKEAS